MWGSEDLADEARAMYETFDCANAVALIAFLGILSNFQDTIEEFTELMNGRRRRRRSEEPVEGWKEMVYSALETFGYGTKSFQPNEAGCLEHLTQNGDHPENFGQTKDTLHDSSNWIEWLSSNENPDTESKRHLLQDLAHTGPVLAMWLVDTGDGRVSGEEGRAGVCRANHSLTNTHGWLGSVAVKLLTNTLVAALSQHPDSKELLDRAGLSAGTVVCENL